MNHQQYINYLITSNAWQEAMALIPVMEAKGVDSWELWKQLADSQFQQGRFPVACEAYERMTLLRPLPVNSQGQLAYCFLRIRKRDLAETVLEHLLYHPKKLELPDLELITRATIRMKSFDLLERVSDEGRSRFPEVALFWFAAGETAKGRGLDRSALKFYEKAVEQDPSDTSFRIALCHQQIACQKLDAAAETLAIDVSSVDSLANLLRIKILFGILNDHAGLCACQSELANWYYRITSELRQEP
ncbi:MAG: hypothetical protein GY917_07030 [Planctomycetaceae bacterium]|nr:hypothetical protein [Planctomycetaceae bacterium]